MRPLISIVVCMLFGLAACAPTTDAVKPSMETSGVKTATVRSANTLGVDVANFDLSHRPQDDFFRYVNGGWLKKTQIPSDRSN